MTVSPTIDSPARSAARRMGLASKLAHAAIALVAFALLAGVWLAFFMFVPLDFTVR